MRGASCASRTVASSRTTARRRAMRSRRRWRRRERDDTGRAAYVFPPPSGEGRLGRSPSGAGVAGIERDGDDLGPILERGRVESAFAAPARARQSLAPSPDRAGEEALVAPAPSP